MTRAELIEAVAKKQPHIPLKYIEYGVKNIFENLASALEHGYRVEVRGFGSFIVRYHPPRNARNPKNGEQLRTAGKFAAKFKAGKELRNRVNGIPPKERARG